MLIAEGPALSPAGHPPERIIPLAAGASAVLHAVLLAGLLVHWQWWAASTPQSMPPIEVELIQSPAMTQGDGPSRPQPPPQDGTGPTAPAPPPPNVNIGNGPEQSDPLTVIGDNVVPPAPDSRFRNQPPSYPADAARIGAEGTVQLTIHVSAQGVAQAVRVTQSSGNESLDGAARRAVQRWHFHPAIEGGQPVPFDYLLNIRFALGDHP